ncbi:MAG: hypothetical protein AB8B56_06460 [Crocinitomicaceae bacterium]
MKNACTYLFLLVAFIGNSQNDINLEKEYLNTLEKVALELIDSTYIYVNDDRSNDLFYYALPPDQETQGTLVLFPPTWQTTESVINHNIELIKLAFANKILVIVPSINYNLYLDEHSMAFLNETFESVLENFSPPKDKMVFGGFSLGGMNAVRYTELAYENETSTTVKPIAVYGVDPPLDFERLYTSFERTIEKNFSKPAMDEAKVYLEKMDYIFGGSPKDFPEIYVRHSMFSKSQKDGGNANYLNQIPVRIYCDPDIDWQLNERRMDYYDMNAVDQTAMINHLILSGNENAEFINALGKGYRLDGRRHPHSWSLVDPEECMLWILDIMK